MKKQPISSSLENITLKKAGIKSSQRSILVQTKLKKFRTSKNACVLQTTGYTFSSTLTLSENNIIISLFLLKISRLH